MLLLFGRPFLRVAGISYKLLGQGVRLLSKLPAVKRKSKNAWAWGGATHLLHALQISKRLSESSEAYGETLRKSARRAEPQAVGAQHGSFDPRGAACRRCSQN